MDAFRGTPRADSDTAGEKNFETDLEFDPEGPPDQFSATEELTEHQEVRYASGADSGRVASEVREPFSLGSYDQNRISTFPTDPRVPFSHDERMTFPLHLQSPPLVSRERVFPSSSSVHESSHVEGNRSMASSEFAHCFRLSSRANLRFDFGFRLERICASTLAFSSSEFALRLRLFASSEFALRFWLSSRAN